MRFPVPNPDGLAVLEVDARPDICVVPGCGGCVVRHSLGGGVAVDRCTRCFRRYQLRGEAADAEKGVFRRIFDEFVTWQDH